MMFQDRADAGRRLAERLEHVRQEAPVVIGLPRGGVIVAAEVAKALGSSVDVLPVRKLAAPSNPELGIGAIAAGGVAVIDEDLAERVGVSAEKLSEIAEDEGIELERRAAAYRVGEPIDVRDRTVLIVDDGLATGITALAAVRTVRERKAKRIVMAAPVCSVQAKELLENEAVEVVCGIVPSHMNAVGAWYEDFTQATDEDVVKALSIPMQ